LLKTNEKTRAIPIYFLSALAMKEDIKKGIDAGADSYITKPFSVTALLNKVESLFNRDMQKPSILCVDDDPVMLQIFNYILKYQFKVSFVADGFEALEHIKMNTPELIITDQKMPGMDGFELITKIRAINDKAKIPCIIVTSLSRQELQPQLNDADPIHFLSKPICYDELLSIVNKLLLVA
ncbi:MAG: response regulator, partial [Gammaproteobacteria bacterium]|nr:response regulator [Gammaproteobacteria bacterium]